MPILKREVDLHPGDLFELEMPSWRVAYVRSRQEKALARYLLQRDVPFYLPQYLQERRTSGRKRVSSLPLFPGYVFLPISARERRTAQESNLLVRLIEVVDQPLLHGELVGLHQLEMSGVPLVPHPYLEIGDEVNIVAGPFKDWRGTILRHQGHLRLIVSVTFLRRSVAASLGRDDVAPATPRAPGTDRLRSSVAGRQAIR